MAPSVPRVSVNPRCITLRPVCTSAATSVKTTQNHGSITISCASLLSETDSIRMLEMKASR